MKFKWNSIKVGFKYDDGKETEVVLDIVHNYDEEEFDMIIIESFIARTDHVDEVTAENLCKYAMNKNIEHALDNSDGEPLICFPYSDIEKNIAK